MLKILIKKQFLELYQNFFQNKKTGKTRSKSASIAIIIAYAVLMIGILGGMFTFLAISICQTLDNAGLTWMYFMIFGSIAIALGVFGSVFSTFSSLYQAKDNDLLLSMPIPSKYILISRLISVYLMGLMFSGVVMLPAIIVYFVVGNVTPLSVIGSILLLFLITVFIFTLSCILGWIVAKISNKLKNKSFITVIVSVAFIGAYYYVYFRATDMINNLIANAGAYGAKIKGLAYPLYLMGSVGAGDIKAILIFTAVIAVLFIAVYYVMSRTFIKTATSSASAKKIKYKEKAYKSQGSNTALLRKEIKRFLSSANYMLNCGLGTLFLIVAAVAIVIKGSDLVAVFNDMGLEKDMLGAIACALIAYIVTMNNITSPSISLDAKTIWLARSLPVKTSQILFAKVKLHLVFTIIPSLICSACTVIILKPSVIMSLMIMALPIAFTYLSALFGLFMNLHLPNLNWTSEIAAVKQSMSVLLSMLIGWAYVIAMFFACFGLNSVIPLWGAVFIAFVVTIALSIVLTFWVENKGTKIYENL